MRTTLLAVAACVAIAGCQSTTPEPLATTVPNHTADPVAAGSAFIWNCTVTEPDSGLPAKFAILKQTMAGRPRTVYAEPGKAPEIVADVVKKGAARMYVLKDRSEIIIAADGELFGQNARRNLDKPKPVGQCDKGGQPV